MSEIRRDAEQVPVEWTLLKAGSNPLMKNGAEGELVLSMEDLAGIADYHAKKGDKIPVDSNHYLNELARAKGMEESEVLKLMPSGVAAMGFGELYQKGDELRIRVDWSPMAHELMKEKIFAYFSPVIRGLKKGPLRITSVAMENEPALNGLDMLAAGAEEPEEDREDAGCGAGRVSLNETRLERALKRLLGRDDALCLDSEGDLERTAEEVEKKAETLERIREETGTQEDEELIRAVHEAKEDAKETGKLREDLKGLQEEREKERKEQLIQQGLRERKLSHAMAERWAATQDSEALAAFLNVAPPVIPGAMNWSKLGRDEPQTMLSDSDLRMIERFQLDQEEFRKCKEALCRGDM